MGRGGRNTILMIGGLLISVSGVEGQRARGPGGAFGVSFAAANPTGDLGMLVDQGFGVEFSGAAPMAAEGHLRIRADLGFLVYGVERIRYCSFGCRLESELTTTNSIVYGGIGPEVVLANGNIQPYVHGSAGFAYFVTSSSLDDRDGYGPYLETTNYSDGVFGFKYGGGIRVRMGGGRKPVFLDLGVERHDNGIANYLTRGDIVDNEDGSITMFPNRSEADLLNFRVGISIGFPSYGSHGDDRRRSGRSRR